MIQLDPARYRSLKSEVWANIIIQWGARELFLLSVFTVYSDNYMRLIAVSVLLMLELGRWGMLTAISTKIDDLQLKLWMDELTWRTAFGRMINTPRSDWDETIREATVEAKDDIKRAQSDADMFSRKTAIWVSVPVKVILQLAMILIDITIVLFLLPFFQAFVGPMRF